jgi:hypothetical protein
MSSEIRDEDLRTAILFTAYVGSVALRTAQREAEVKQLPEAREIGELATELERIGEEAKVESANLAKLKQRMVAVKAKAHELRPVLFNQ